MLETIRDKDKNILAVCEYYVVDDEGHFNESGQYIWIEQLEFSSMVNGNGLGYVQEFIKRIIKNVPWCKAGYFRRGKYNNRVKLYSRRRWEKLLKSINMED